jgi:hypothetical protein
MAFDSEAHFRSAAPSTGSDDKRLDRQSTRPKDRHSSKEATNHKNKD